ncbi:hypothetical protein [Glycomyces dulcitolivorans]|uniref:hypothetical protein n=1 Tax=Glycomyces dulcitolivorans TaxID=2200759 RepID=UPI001300A0F7|nr:hypothetical protein [Glycomyces dulcitolivorans]
MRTIVNRLRRSANRTFGRGAVFVAAVAAVAVFALPGAAHADSYYIGCGDSGTSCQTGTAVEQTEGNCMVSDYAFGSTVMCVKYDGDLVYVYDGRADGYAAMALVETSNGSVHERYCRNNLGYGNWAVCNFDWAEAGSHVASSGYKSNYSYIVTQELWSWTAN